MDFEAYGIEVYIAHLPAHKFIYIKDEEELDSGADHIRLSGGFAGHPDDPGSGLLSALIYKEETAIQALGIRLKEEPASQPPGLLLTDVAGGDYLVFQHGPFDLESQGPGVRNILQELVAGFDYDLVDFEPDHSEGRLAYFYFEPEHLGKWVVPIKEKP